MFSAEYRTAARPCRHLVGGTLAGLIGALVCFAAAHAAGSDLVVDARGGQMSVPAGAVVFASLLGAGGGWGMAVLALRRPRPRRSFLTWAAAGLLLSVIPPLQAAVSWTAAAWLMGMHVAVAATLVPAVAVALPVGPVPARAPDLLRPDAAEATGP